MSAVTEAVRNLFAYDFILRAVIVGMLISICAALLGVSLVLRRCSMIGDGLSHVGFGTLAVAAALGVSSLKISLPVVILVAFFILKLSESGRMRGDAMIALLSTGALAVGVMIVSLSGSNMNLMDFLFGSVFALDWSDVNTSLILSVVVLVLYVLFYNKIFAVTFDGAFARATGTREGLYNSLISVLTAVTIVIGMRFMGALLISSLIIFPPLTAMRLCRSFRSVILCTAAVSAGCFFTGMVISVGVANAPAGASVVCVNAVLFLIFSLISFVRSRIRSRSAGRT